MRKIPVQLKKVYNTDQNDSDSDGLGDLCEEPPKIL